MPIVYSVGVRILKKEIQFVVTDHVQEYSCTELFLLQQPIKVTPLKHCTVAYLIFSTSRSALKYRNKMRKTNGSR